MCPTPSSKPWKAGTQFILGTPWRSMKPALTHTYGKKATKPSLMVVVAPTTTEIGDDYFLNKLHEPACIKRRSVYYSAKVAGKRSRVQVVICPYCGVLSQNAHSGLLPTSGGTWDSLLPVGVADSSAWRLPKSSKSTLESARRH